MDSSLKNDRLLRALHREPVDTTPVWIMRQAGRYLPEYRATRKRAGSFLNLCKTPELACEVTMQPIDRYPLDAAIVFSDILTIPDAMGLGLRFIEGEGPVFDRPIQNIEDIRRIGIPDPEQDLKYVMDAIRLIRSSLNGRIPLIGFSGSPWTLATYMVEGKSSRHFSAIKKLMYDHPQAMTELLDKITDSVILYLQAQVAAGAQVLMIFDTWGGNLSTDRYLSFSLNHIKKIATTLKNQTGTKQIPIIMFTKGGGQWLESMAVSGCDGVGIDWTTDIARARQLIGNKVAIQGNLDPAILASNPETIVQETQKILTAFGDNPGHIFNLGHGITPDIDPEKVGILIETVHQSR